MRKNVKYVNKEELDEAIKEYFQNEQYCYGGDLEMILTSFKDPYDCPWIFCEYIEQRVIDDKKYTVMACFTWFGRMGLRSFSDSERFRFYMLMHRKDESDETVGAYLESERLYMIDPKKITKKDFPKWSWE